MHEPRNNETPGRGFPEVNLRDPGDDDAGSSLVRAGSPARRCGREILTVTGRSVNYRDSPWLGNETNMRTTTDAPPLWRALLDLEAPDQPEAPDPGAPTDAFDDEGIPF
jgi:hypothetical protein